MQTRFSITGLVLAVGFLLAGCGTMDTMEEDQSMADMSEMEEHEVMGDMESMSGGSPASFTVTIEVLRDSPTPIAPVAWAVYTGDNPLFTLNSATRIEGLEALAEDGDPAAAVQALSASMEVTASGVAEIPVGSMDAGSAAPGWSYSFSFQAAEGEKLTFATMYVQSNDLFFSPAAGGIELFDMGSPISGDITSEIYLYDAGTEANEAPGSGPNQAPRQGRPNTGPEEMGAVRLITEVSDGFMYPAAARVLKVTVSAM